MKKENIEKYVSGFSPEMQEIARYCKDTDEIDQSRAYAGAGINQDP